MSGRGFPWGAVLAIAAIGTGVAVAVKANARPKEVGPVSPGTPAPANPLLQPVTDPVEIRQWQTSVATLLQNPSDAKFIGLTPADYTPADVDGDPNNPKWRRVVAAVQATINQKLPEVRNAVIPPAWLTPDFPAQVRGDGILDRATLIIMSHF